MRDTTPETVSVCVCVTFESVFTPTCRCYLSAINTCYYEPIMPKMPANRPGPKKQKNLNDCGDRQ